MATYDTVGTASVVFSATSITSGSFSPAASSNRGICIAVYHNANTATGITASSGGVSGSAISGTDTGTAQARRTFMFAVPASNSGSQTATCSWTNACDAYLSAFAYYDVDQTTPFDNGTSANGTTGAPTVTPSAGSDANDRSIGVYTATGGGGNLQSPVLHHITGTTLNFDGTEATKGSSHGCSDYFATWLASAVNVKTAPGAPPTIDSNPTDQTAASGGSATFSATASGYDSVQWQKMDPLSGAITSVGQSPSSLSLELTGLARSDGGGLYRLKASNTNGDSYSTWALLRVTSIPSSYSGAGLVIGSSASFIGESMVGAPDSSGISASLAQTEASDTVSSAATLALAASASPTEANDSGALSGALALNASSAPTEGDDSPALAAGVGIAADFSQTEEDDSLSSAADIVTPISADLAQTEEDDSLSSAAGLLLSPSLAQTEEDDSLLAASALALAASLAQAEESDAASSAAALALAASLSQTEEDDSLSAVAALEILASLAQSEEDDALSSAANVSGEILADLTQAEESDVASSAAALAISSAVAQTEQDDSGSSGAALAIDAALLQNEEADSLSAQANTGAPISADLAATEEDDSSSITASLEQAGTSPPSTSISGLFPEGGRRRRRTVRVIGRGQATAPRPPAIRAEVGAVEQDDVLNAGASVSLSDEERRSREIRAAIALLLAA